MTICKRCGLEFHCAMSDPGPDGKADTQPCWCTAMPPAVPVPDASQDLTCWCPACLKDHIAKRQQC